MKRKGYLLFIVIIYLMFSCKNENRTQEVIETVIHHNILIDIGKMADADILDEQIDNIDNYLDLYEDVEPEEIFNRLNYSESREAIINTDCDYTIGGKPSGRLTEGQRIRLLENYNLGRFDVRIAFETLDGTIKGQVSEDYLTYIYNQHELWFKDMMLVREYFYTGTVEEINKNSHYNTIDNWTLTSWRYVYSEYRIRITDGYLVIGDSEDSRDYRLESIIKRGNIYTIHLSNMLGDEYEITLVDDGNGITITNYIIKSERAVMDGFRNSLNFRYVPYDAEKSEMTKRAVITWINEQLALLAKNTP